MHHAWHDGISSHPIHVRKDVSLHSLVCVFFVAPPMTRQYITNIHGLPTNSPFTALNTRKGYSSVKVQKQPTTVLHTYKKKTNGKTKIFHLRIVVS